jgi:tetratricopeptide (TPR) repeat protein
MRALGLLLLVLLGACASTPQSARIRDIAEGSLPASLELVDTPFFPQSRYQCGPAALATVLQSQGGEATPEQLAHQIYLPDRKGSLQIEIVAAARQHQMLPYLLEPKMASMLAELAAGNPVLVLQNLGFDWFPQWHYAVVIGYDLDRNEVILRSGKTRRWVTALEVFERTWARADYWALAIVPVGQIPATATPSRYLQVAYSFEETGRPELARSAYLAAADYWPDRPENWLALGNAFFQDQDLAGAVKAFETATRLAPESADTWNNLAYAMHALGCEAGARAALKCGLQHVPDNENLLDSQQELTTTPVQYPNDSCPLIQCN